METTNQLKGELFVKDKHPGHQNGLANYSKKQYGGFRNWENNVAVLQWGLQIMMVTLTHSRLGDAYMHQ